LRKTFYNEYFQMKVLHKLSQATKETRQLQLDKITDRGKKTKIPINLGKLFTLEVLQG